MEVASANRTDFAALVPGPESYKRPPTPIIYRLWLLPAALIMLALPVIYAAVVVLAAYLVYFHAVYNRIGIFSAHVSSLYIIMFECAIYIGPILAGLVVVFFLTKPFFARAPKRHPYPLNPEVEHELYAFIAKVCHAVGAPAPRRIDLDCELNASASFRRGFLSFLGNDMVLTIGLPFMGTLNVDEFAGILAHEFGHFSQGLAMRLRYVVNWINGWFIRAVYQRDGWDRILDEMLAESGWMMFIVTMCVRMGLAISRGILWIFMMAAVAVSGSLSRQMEFNADAFEINLIGSETAERTIRKLAVVGEAMRKVQKDMVQMWRTQHTLPDNITQYLLLTIQDMPEMIRNQIDDRLGLAETRWHHNHPSDADRIRQIRRAQQPALITCAVPASGLFANFQIPAKAVTVFWYHDLRIPITPDRLTTFRDEEKERRDRASVSAEVVTRYFVGALPLLQPVSAPFQPISSEKLGEARQNIREFRARIEPVKLQIEPAVVDFTYAEARSLQMLAARAVLECSAAIDAELYGLPEATVAAVDTAIAESAATKTKTAHAMREVTGVIRRHFTTSLALLRLPPDLQWISAAEQKQALAKPHLTLVNQMSDVWPKLMECRREHAVLSALSPLSRNLEAQKKIGETSRQLDTLLFRLREATAAIVSPFQPGQKAGCLFDTFAVPSPGSAVNEIQERARAVVEGFLMTYEQSLAQLAEIAEKIEEEC